jgi:hypothetical protein
MPYAQPATMALPFASGSDTSRAGAEAVKASAPTQCLVMAELYRRHQFSGVTDAEMTDYTGYPANVVCARRSDLQCVEIGRRMGKHGVMVKAWTLGDGR